MSGSPPQPVAAVYFASDYGTDDEFVGVVHAVLHRHAPGVPVIDLAHEVPPFDVRAGAELLVRCAPVMGAGVVLAVVDPGVGSDRRAIAIAPASAPPPELPEVAPNVGPHARLDALSLTSGPGWIVGPDNGLLVPLATALGGVGEARWIDPAGARRRGWPAVSGTTTFDGRDLFAPAAAHLARGEDPKVLGPVLDPDDLVSVPSRLRPAHVPTPGTLVALVSWIDRFGNVQLDTGSAALEDAGIGAGSEVEVTVARSSGAAEGSYRARRVVSFAAAGPGEIGLLIDSSGKVTLVCDRASAAARLGRPAVGDEVRISAAHS